MNSGIDIKKIDNYRKNIDRFISGYRADQKELIEEFPEIMKILIKNRNEDGVSELLQDLKGKYLRIHDITNQHDCKDSAPTIPLDLSKKLQKAIVKDKLDWHASAEILANAISFVSVADSGEFLYYDSPHGIWTTGAEELISKILRDAYSDRMTKHVREEIISHIRDSHYIFSEFVQESGLLINCINGVINVNEMKLLPHSPDYHFRYVIPVRFNIRAKCPKILSFLEDVFKDDLNKALKILEFFAYCLIPGYPIQKALTLLGNGNNGKSVTLGILSSLLGKKNIASISLQTLAYSRFAGAELKNKLADIAGDVSGGELRDTSFFKLLTGGDYLSAEMKMVQKRPVFKNSAKLIFAFNQLPRSTDQAMAFFRRFEVVKFIQSFAGKEDKQLLSKLTSEEELSGLLNLLASVFIPSLFRKETFHDSMTIEEIQLEYNLSADPALAFIQEHIEVDPERQVEITELYQKFTSWCKVKGLNPATPEGFGYSLRNLSGMIVHKRRVQEEGTQKNYYSGIRYIEEIKAEMATEKKLHRFIKIPNSIEEAIYNYVEEYMEGGKSCIGCIGFFIPRNNQVIHLGVEKAMQPMKPMQPIFKSEDNRHNNDITIRMLQNGNTDNNPMGVAGVDKNYYLRDGDIVHLPRNIARILINKGKAVAIN